MWRYLALRKLGTVTLETLLLSCCVLFPLSLPLNYPHRQLLLQWRELLPKTLLLVIVFQIFLQLRDVYDFRKTRPLRESTLRLAEALVLSHITLWTVHILAPALSLSRPVVARSLILGTVYLFSWHMLLRLHYRFRKPMSNILVLGTGRLARELTGEILRHPELGMGVRGFVDDDPALVGISIVNPRVIGLYRDLPRLVGETRVDRIVVELHDRRGRLPIDELLAFKSRGLAVEEATALYERVTGKIAIENLKPSWMIFNSGFEGLCRRRRLQKQAFETVLAAICLFVTVPLDLLIMLLIKLDSRGSIFHRQARVGQDGRPFTLYKFRSMFEDAEQETGPVWAALNDKRVTRVGRILRRSRLDELPQLYNILRGDMSLVGPRPERPEFVRELAANIPFYNLRHIVKPGVTGWAQICYEYANSVEDSIEKLQYDLFYIKHMSAFLDAIILLGTIKTVLVRKGS